MHQIPQNFIRTPPLFGFLKTAGPQNPTVSISLASQLKSYSFAIDLGIGDQGARENHKLRRRLRLEKTNTGFMRRHGSIEWMPAKYANALVARNDRRALGQLHYLFLDD
jgi:hypothetical protein